ncbi:MAG: hypothetical protein FJ109_10840, partial [Deltaproteobacteria bacterium]|nr:hypothetical protein [Deltaproteobacteria bacterium]
GGDPDGFTFGGTCEGKECGTDGKGNSCGICAPDKYCIAGKCTDPDEPSDATDQPPADSDVTGDEGPGHPVGEGYVLPEIADPEADSDGDGIKDPEDNCPFDKNPSQMNSDDDEGGDVCDPDDDNDSEKDDTDCDPKNPYVNHFMAEKCNGFDDNCNGQIDEPGAVGCIPYYKDNDGDGFGTFETKQCQCDSIGPGYSIKFGDCNDQEPKLSPGAPEICDDVDNDCDGALDEGCDEDGDDWCNINLPVVGFPATCPFGPGDCYDGAGEVNPGQLETAGDGLDNNCNGQVDEPVKCPGQCTGHTVDAYLCALEMCFGPAIISAQFSSPTGDSIESAWEAVSHFGSGGNDLKPWGGDSYALLASGPCTGTSHSTDLPGGSSIGDPYAKDGYQTFDNVEFKVVLKAPANALGFAIDYIFFSEEYEEYIGTSFNDKFYIFLTAPQTTGGQKVVINSTACSNPNAYYDFIDQGQKKCYIAINTAFSEPCSNPKTNISGTGYECGPPDSAHGSSTGWLTTSWQIKAGEQFELVFHIHDASDGIFDSEVILDNFHWLSTPFTPGTATHQ